LFHPQINLLQEAAWVLCQQKTVMDKGLVIFYTAVFPDEGTDH